MADIGKTLDSLPGWVAPVIIVGVVLLAVFSRGGSSGGGGTTGNTTVYSPVNADPGLVSLAQSEVSARQSVFQSALSIVGAEDMSRESSARDIAISTINASVTNARTRASETVSLAQSDSATQIGLANARTAATIAGANADAAFKVANVNAAQKTSQAHIEAKTKMGDQIVSGVKAIGSGIAHLFGF